MPCCYGASQTKDCQFGVEEDALVVFNGQKYCPFHLPLSETVSGIASFSEKAEMRRRRVGEDFNKLVGRFIAVQHARGQAADLSGTQFPCDFTLAPLLPYRFLPDSREVKGGPHPILFSGCEFHGAADFSGVALVGQASFDQAIFHGDASFAGTEFEASPTFRGASFATRLAFTPNTAARADFSQADLQGVDLSHADLRGANLEGTHLSDALLRNADLTQVRNLLPSQLAGTDLQGAVLDPKSAGRFDLLWRIDDLSRYARLGLIALLMGCGAVALGMGLADDAVTLADRSTPWMAFQLAAPALLLLLFANLHLYLQRLWDAAAQLPARFPDGRQRTEVISPWLMCGLSGKFSEETGVEPPPFFRLQRTLSVALAWWIAPLTLLTLWMWSLPHLMPVRGAYFLSYLFLGLLLSLWFHREARATLNGRPGLTGLGQWWALASAAAITGALLLIQGMIVRGDLPDPGRVMGWMRLDAARATLSPLTIGSVRTGEDCPVRSTTQLTGRNLRGLVADGANLMAVDLRGALLPGASLTDAEMSCTDLSPLPGREPRSSDLFRADLSQAVLVGANLTAANLAGAALRDAELTDSVLFAADLRAADLSGANLERADLRRARMWSAVLKDADLTDATLTGADLRGADLRGAKITQSQLEQALINSTTTPPERFLPENP